jgi:chromosome segregation ATPase
MTETPGRDETPQPALSPTDDLRTGVQNLEARLSVLAAEHDRRAAEGSEHAAALRRLETQLTQLMADRERLALDGAERLVENRAIHQRLAAMKIERDRFATESAERQAWLRELESRLVVLTAERDALRQQRDSLAKQLAAIRSHPVLRLFRLRHRLLFRQP